jgi:hypothetical protein
MGDRIVTVIQRCKQVLGDPSRAFVRSAVGRRIGMLIDIRIRCRKLSIAK